MDDLHRSCLRRRTPLTPPLCFDWYIRTAVGIMASLDGNDRFTLRIAWPGSAIQRQGQTIISGCDDVKYCITGVVER